MKKLLSILIFASAALEIYSEYFARQFVYIFKPLTMIFIIALVWFYGKTKGFYFYAILAGLAFSLLGDVLLIDSKNYFVYGLASFLIAHLFYTAAFGRAGAGKFNFISLSAFLIGGLMFALIFAGVPAALKIPVSVYTLAISLMLATAFNFWLNRKTPAALSALAGAFFFVVSDSTLAYNRFRSEFFLARLCILATYFFAQWLIAHSV